MMMWSLYEVAELRGELVDSIYVVGLGGIALDIERIQTVSCYIFGSNRKRVFGEIGLQ